MPIRIEVVQGETDNIAFGGKRTRKSTVLMRIRAGSSSVSLSKKALTLGVILAVCQVLDGLLTYTGLQLFGVKMEGNGLLRDMMHYYGMLPALIFVKFFAIFVAGLLVIYANERRWIRPLLCCVIVIYFLLALIPWAVLISDAHVTLVPV